MPARVIQPITKADLRSMLTRFETDEHNIAVSTTADPAATARATLLAEQPNGAKWLTARKPCGFVKSVPIYFLFSKSDLILVDVTPEGLASPERTYGLTFDQLSELSQAGHLFLNILSFPRTDNLEDKRFLAYHAVGSRLAWLLDPGNGHHLYYNDARKLILFKALGCGKGLDHFRGQAEAAGFVEAVQKMRAYVERHESGGVGPVGNLASYRQKIDPEKINENIAYMLAFMDAQEETRADDALLTGYVDCPEDLLRDPRLTADFVSRVYTFHARRTAPYTGAYAGHYPRDWTSVGRQALNTKHTYEVMEGQLEPADIAEQAHGQSMNAGLLEFLYRFSREEIGRNLDTMHLPMEAAAINSSYGLTGVIEDQGRLNDVIAFMRSMAGPAEQYYLGMAQRHFAKYEMTDLSVYDHLRALADANEGRRAVEHWSLVRARAADVLGAIIGSAPTFFPKLTAAAAFARGIPLGLGLNMISSILGGCIEKGMKAGSLPWMVKMFGPHSDLIHVVGTLSQRDLES